MQGKENNGMMPKQDGKKTVVAAADAPNPSRSKAPEEGNKGAEVSHHQISLPKGGGAIAGIGEKFQTNPVTGTASFSVPVSVTPDRSGFEPKMSLSYDSGVGNGVFGLGWSIDIPSVSRKTGKALPRYDDGGESDVFLMSGAEDLVPVPGGSITGAALYRPRVEGIFARIEKLSGPDGVYWRATSKAGVTSIYGQTDEYRISDPDDRTRVFKWLLQCSRDAKGNVVWYRYKAEDTAGVESSPFEANRLGSTPNQKISNKHISEIHYGIKQGESLSSVAAAAPDAVGELFHFSLVFDYGEQEESEVPDYGARGNVWSVRPDPFSRYQAGFEVRTYRLCRRITLFHRFETDLGASPIPVKGMVFRYRPGETATYLDGITVQGYKFLGGDEWEIISLPELVMSYSRAAMDPEIKRVDVESLENLPQGIGDAYRLLDLEGEGLPGIFVEQGGAWFYKRNNGNGRFGALKRLNEKPTPSTSGGQPQLVDVNGDGNTELVLTGDGMSGYYSYIDGRWEDFRYFRQRINSDLSDPRLKQIDLTGDGRPDLLMAEDNVFTWHESLLEEGFGEAQRRYQSVDEEQGPRVVFAEARQSVFLADMSGDGLTDIVRIRNGEVCYWPNLGYGRFGAKVTMADAPYFDAPDVFNPAYVKLGDVDGSGTADVFYFGNNTAKCWLNQAGNSFAQVPDRELPGFLPVDSASTVSIADLMGRGTSCVVWSTTNPGKDHLQLSYVDLMSRGKPHLLTGIVNNMGKAVRITYAPSTEEYLRDREAGAPWITKLPFPVQVLKEVETRDLIGGTVHDATYRYHHGFFDGREREFRGFGCVESLDTKSFEKYRDTDQGVHYVAPVLTRTWFHNGAFVEAGRISKQYEEEYFVGANATSPDVLPDTVIETPAALCIEELREAYRSMKGKALRQEIWTADPMTGEPVDGAAPYTVAESNFLVRRIQERGDNENAVFVVHPRETMTWHYEQNAADARVTHDFTLAADGYGNITRTASLVYPRSSSADGYLPAQGVPHVTCSVTAPINKDIENGDSFYRVGTAGEQQRFEVGGLTPSYGTYLLFDDVATAVDAALSNVIPFEQRLSTGAEARRLSWQRNVYWNETQTAALTGDVTDKVLLHHVESAVFTPGVISDVYGGDIVAADLGSAGYLFSDGHWWNPGLVQHYDTGDFHLPIRTADPWGNGITVTWDAYGMSPVSTEDALRNSCVAEIDYRTMRPRRVVDSNQNSSEAITDALGTVIATSIYGEENGATKGDLPLTGNYVEQYDPDAPGGPIPNRDHILSNPAQYLQSATAYFFYDVDAWSTRQEPVQVIGLTRETHVSELGAGETTRIQKTVSYTDGFGRELQSKLAVEPGPAWVRQADDTYREEDVDDRWLSSGRTVYNNKEKPVKQYEPFYTAAPAYEPEAFFATFGVTQIIHYDPLLRPIRTDMPYKRIDDGSGNLQTLHVHTRVELTPWQEKTFDANDTVVESEYGQAGGLSGDELEAYTKAAAHADTPLIADLDTLGRQFSSTAVLTLDSANAPDLVLQTLTEFDITGNPLKVTDPRGNDAFEYVYDMLGQPLRTVSIDGGDDRAFANIMGKPVITLDLRGHRVTAAYDALHRPVSRHVSGGDGDPLNHVVERTIYGESHPNATSRNMRGKMWQGFDPSGKTEIIQYSIQGKPVTSQKRIRTAYRSEASWPDDEVGREALLETETFETRIAYDALGRVVLQHNPDTSVSHSEYLQSGKLDRIRVTLNGASGETDFVTSITYNAKGQREQIDYGNGTRTIHSYDDATYRLTSLVTTRLSDNQALQDIDYVYDPVGNVIKARDTSHEGVFANNGPVQSEQRYSYDAVYRLLEATGREHTELSSVPFFNDPNSFKQSRHTLLNNMNLLSNYTRQYTYDDGSNLTRIRHLGTHPFTRNIAVDTGTNRALPEPDAGTPDFVGSFDQNGNQVRIDHLAGIAWDYRDNIAKATVIERASSGGTDDAEYYVYDAAGARVRKVTERVDSGNLTIEEKIYLGGVEIKRFHRLESGVKTTRLDRSDLHVMDDKSRIAVVNRWSKDDLLLEIEDPGQLNTPRLRYQFANHLGSSSLELDDASAIISYEEYFPFGGTSFIAGNNQKEVRLKTYRYTGKERDDTTGFYYHGARYYAPWVGRWMSADPLGSEAGSNLYAYVRNNPLRLMDPYGMSDDDVVDNSTDSASDEPEDKKKKKKKINVDITPPSAGLKPLELDLSTEFKFADIKKGPFSELSFKLEPVKLTAKSQIRKGPVSGLEMELDTESLKLKGTFSKGPVGAVSLKGTKEGEIKLGIENLRPFNTVELGVETSTKDDKEPSVTLSASHKGQLGRTPFEATGKIKGTEKQLTVEAGVTFGQNEKEGKAGSHPIPSQKEYAAIGEKVMTALDDAADLTGETQTIVESVMKGDFDAVGESVKPISKSVPKVVESGKMLTQTNARVTTIGLSLSLPLATGTTGSSGDVPAASVPSQTPFTPLPGSLFDPSRGGVTFQLYLRGTF